MRSKDIGLITYPHINAHFLVVGFLLLNTANAVLEMKKENC
jgi:hypothetical protein